MRSRGAGVVIAIATALGACDSGGMEILVYGPSDPGTPAPHTVKLFVGLGEPAMDAIAPAPGTGARFLAPRWDRDPGNTEDSVEYGKGPARFVFQGGNGIDKLGAVIAVGYDDAGTPTSSELLVGPEMGNAHLKVYRMGLNAFTNPIQKRAGYNSLELWGPRSANGSDDSCAFVQNTYPGPTSSAAFITTPGDRDCDGIADTPTPPECDPAIWNSSRVSTKLSDLSCLLTDSLGQTNGTFCMLGAGRCKDGVGVDQSCSPSRYCVHPTVCEACGPGVQNDPFACASDLRKVSGSSADIPMIHCDINFISTMSGEAGPCPTANTFDLTTIGLPPNIKCTGVHVRNTTQGFANKLTDPLSPNATFSVDVDDACTLTVTGGGAYANTNAITPLVSGLLLVDFGTNQHGIAHPIEIKVSPTLMGQCAPATCHLTGAPTDQLEMCVPIAPGP